MGYETKVFIVKAPVNPMPSKLLKTDSGYQHLWKEDGKEEFYHFGADGDTKTMVIAEDAASAITLSWCSVIASVDLCKLGPQFDYPKKESEFYFYDRNDFCVVEDAYGDKLKQLTLDEAIELFSKVEEYRRTNVLNDLLSSINKNMANEEIYVLTYGY